MVNDFARVTEYVGRLLSGVVARPLYRCTGRFPQGMCMAFASTPQIFQGGQGRREYPCRWCARRSERTIVADSEPLRVLLLHAFTAPEGGQDFAVRLKTVRVVVCAPPHK